MKQTTLGLSLLAGFCFVGILLVTGCSDNMAKTDFLPGETVCFGDESVLVIRRGKYSNWVEIRVDGLLKAQIVGEKSLTYC